MKFLKHLAQGALVGTIVAILANAIGGWIGALIYFGFFTCIGFYISNQQDKRRAEAIAEQWAQTLKESRKRKGQ